MGSLRDGTVKLSPYGPAVTAETRKAVTPILEAMKQGKFRIFKGPLKDNTGSVVIPDGKSLPDNDDAIWGMNYLVEGVIGNIDHR